ncbi:MAG: sulfatase [Acidobacteriota bacterium]
MLTRRNFLGTLAATAAAQPRRQPNIVVLFADDLGYGELGFQGNPEIPTPHVDSIAANGIRFTNGYVSAPFCCPSRAGLMTGRYQTRFGHEMNAVGKTNLNPRMGLPLTERTMANHLKDAGYATGLIGKWHLGANDKFHPQRRGFDEFFGFLHEGHFYFPPPYRGGLTRLRTNEPPYDEENPLLRGTEPIVEKEYLTDALAREAVSFIDRHQSNPFFLYLAFNAIHSPMQAPVPMLKEFESIKDEQRRLFAAMLRSMDNAVGRVLAKLRELNLEEDTLIFFISDNGGPTQELTSSNLPMRGGKGQLFEGGIRIPFAVQWKGTLPAGKIDHRPVISLDVLPTALAAAGKPVPAHLDGVNLLPYLRGAGKGGQGTDSRAPHPTLFWRYGKNIALREGKWKLVRQGGDAFQLFDLDRDASETTDRFSQEPQVAARLRTQLDRFNGEMAAPLW